MTMNKGKTKVINARSLKGNLYDFYRDDKYVYIGRYIYNDIRFPQSKWHNPFKLKDLDYNEYRRTSDITAVNQELVRMYREYIMNKPELLKDIQELKGKTLICWCKPSLPCHGDVLVELLEHQTKITDYFKIE